MSIHTEREEEIDRLRGINAGTVTDSRTDFSYRPGSDGCGCAVCEKRRRLGIDCRSCGIGYGRKVQGRFK